MTEKHSQLREKNEWMDEEPTKDTGEVTRKRGGGGEEEKEGKGKREISRRKSRRKMVGKQQMREKRSMK